ncbi:MAG TPA: tetratricopeptide repeat protein [Thermoanaerobaculia bacterium]|nr:tetratricopeptide repeat protein [Thermoanaerobaculia bacterium]
MADPTARDLARAEAHLGRAERLLAKERKVNASALPSAKTTAEFERATALFQRALERWPGHLDALAGLGRAYLGLDENAAAVRACEPAFRQAPTHLPAAQCLLRGLLALDEIPEALDTYRSFAKAKPSRADRLADLLCRWAEAHPEHPQAAAVSQALAARAAPLAKR